MIRKKVDINKIITFLKEEFLAVYGNTEEVYIDNLADLDHINEYSLDWVKESIPNKQKIVEASKARCILVDSDILYSTFLKEGNKTLLVVKCPKRALAKIGNEFFVEKPKNGIHPTACIHSKAKIGKNVSVGAYCVIGKAIIGDNCIIDSNVRIYDGVVLGNNCEVKAGAVLGGAGFGYERDADGSKFRFPQIGQLIIGDYVEVGSNTCIDRGALSDTVIGDYTKINNLCHIAHNNKIGRNVTITGCVNISGSNIIDDDVWVAPYSSIRGWLHIGKGSTIGMGSVVVKDIPSCETWVGNPAHKLENKR